MYLPPLGWKLPPDSLCTNSKLFFPPFFLPNEPVVDDKKYFWDKFLTSKTCVSNYFILSYYTSYWWSKFCCPKYCSPKYWWATQNIVGQNIDGRNIVAQNIGGRNIFTQNIGGLPKILVVDSKYCWAKYWWAGQMPYISDLAWPHLTRVNHLPSIQRRKILKKSKEIICLCWKENRYSHQCFCQGRM